MYLIDLINDILNYCYLSLLNYYSVNYYYIINYYSLLLLPRNYAIGRCYYYHHHCKLILIVVVILLKS